MSLGAQGQAGDMGVSHTLYRFRAWAAARERGTEGEPRRMVETAPVGGPVPGSQQPQGEVRAGRPAPGRAQGRRQLQKQRGAAAQERLLRGGLELEKKPGMSAAGRPESNRAPFGKRLI